MSKDTYQWQENTKKTVTLCKMQESKENILEKNQLLPSENTVPNTVILWYLLLSALRPSKAWKYAVNTLKFQTVH